MSLSLDDLQLLIDIVDCGSFSKAAARWGWSQPQVSQRVSALEKEIGAQLFARHRRGAIATAACETYLPAAREALALLEAGKQAVQGAPALPKMTIACMPSLASEVFAPVLMALAEANMEIRCSTDHSSVIMERILSGNVQVGVILKCPPIAGIQMESVCRSPIVAVVGQQHRLASAGKLTLREIANERLAPQYWGEGCDELRRLIRCHRKVNGPIHAIQPASAAIGLALEHGFLTFMPEMAIKRDLRDGRLVKLQVSDLPHWEWQVMMAWRSGKRSDASQLQVLETIRAMAPQWE